MNGWYSRVDEAPWERRKERRLGTETEENSSPSWSLTVEIKEKYQRAKGGKQQRIQCPLKGQKMLMSFAEKRILSINLQLHCLPAEEWDDAGNVRKSEDEDDMITIKDSWHALRVYAKLSVLPPSDSWWSILFFVPFHNPTGVLSPPRPHVSVS